MPTFLDTHNFIPGLTADGLAQAHARDVQVGEKYGVKYLKYWFDETSGKVYCLAEGPDPEALAVVHREAHGLVADEIVRVTEGG